MEGRLFPGRRYSNDRNENVKYSPEEKSIYNLSLIQSLAFTNALIQGVT